MEQSKRVVTLLTDFGLRDHYVAAMKGVMLGINPELHFVDISHAIPRQDVWSAAFTLGQAFSCFPAGTIHLAVVDPGVGTERRAIAAAAGGYFFVAPDNGILTHVYRQAEGAEVFEVTADHYFRKPVSSTFHGRDIFAPVAAWISRDVALKQLGSLLGQPVHLKVPAMLRVRDNLIQGAVLAQDHFGNVITNLKPEDVPAYSTPGGRACKILVAQREISTFRRTFGEGQPGELFVVPGSSGYLEIVVRGGSAAAELNLAPGALIGVVIS
ncbi:MAG: SAM-dependent chlorinase/fluorinase [Acidobacteria bacterium]|nr:SAM-dependent chlorinase/fluorinase [Acidobacteriota bacterium]